jgi:hypothetical protein
LSNPRQAGVASDTSGICARMTAPPKAHCRQTRLSEKTLCEINRCEITIRRNRQYLEHWESLVALLSRDLGFFNRISSIFLFGCALALATIASPQKVLAQIVPPVQICKETNPSPDTTGTAFNFIGFRSSGPATLFTLSDGQCKGFPGGDWKFTETVPSGWTLSAINCGPATVVFEYVDSLIHAKPHRAFQPGDDTVSFSAPGIVHCKFVNGPQQTGTLSVIKIVDPDIHNIGKTLSFGMSVNCTTSSGTTPYSVNVTGDGTAVQLTLGTAVANLAVGSVCTIDEGIPPPLLTSTGDVYAGCLWQLPPKYSPSPSVTIAAGANVVTVTNTYTCGNTGVLAVSKVVDPDPLKIGGTLSFQITPQWSNHYGNGNPPALTVLGNTTAMVANLAGTLNVATGSTFYIISETQPTLPAGCSWLPAKYSPPSQTTGLGTNVETVTNGYTCEQSGQTGTLSVAKVVNPDIHNIGKTLSFGMSVNCTTSSGTNSYSVKVTGDGTAVQLTVGTAPANLPVGSVCTIDEATPPPIFVSGAPGCLWQLPPQYSPSPSVTIAAGTNLVTVTNTYTCGNMGSLTITKKVDPDPLGIGGTLSFQIGSTLWNTTGYGYGYQTVQGNATYGPALAGQDDSTLTFTEDVQLPTLPPPLPLPPLPAGCSWLPPTFSPPTVTLSPAVSVETVTNGYQCANTLTVAKVVNPDPRNIWSTTTTGSTTPFPITVTCTPPGGGTPVTVPLSVLGNYQDVTDPKLVNLPAGSKCTLVETLPAAPKGCTWLAPKYLPQTVVINSGMMLNRGVVTNGYKCGAHAPTNPDGTTQPPPPAGCRPPMVPGAVAGSCVCPQGTVREGETCVAREHTQPPPKACPAPMVPGAAAGSCVCPRGTMLEDGACVARQPTQQPEQQPYFGPAPGPGREGPAVPGNSGPGFGNPGAPGPGFGNPGAPGPGFGGPARH